MKNDIRILDKVLKDESNITEYYNRLTASAITVSKKKLPGGDKRKITDLVNIASSIEKIGDCCVSLVEQIEYKITEKALFSEVAVQEYQNLHSKVNHILSDLISVMRIPNPGLTQTILESFPSINNLVDTYRANHIDRSARGVCDDWARIRYLEMLDITKTIAAHCVDITRDVKD